MYAMGPADAEVVEPGAHDVMGVIVRRGKRARPDFSHVCSNTTLKPCYITIPTNTIISIFSLSLLAMLSLL